MRSIASIMKVRIRLLSRIGGALLALPSGALAQGDHTHPAASGPSMSGMDRRVSSAVNEEMAGSMIMSTHMRMSPSRRATAADSARALALLDQMHRSLDKYRNVQVAESDGFTQFLPNVPQPVYHFTNLRWSIAEAFRFDPSHPSSLLYRKSSHGDFTLIGAMYTARRNASTDDLDSRIPLGISRWHQHVNWCIPRKGDQDRWRETRDGSPLFGPQSPIATREECDRIDGAFHPNVFGWMVHVNAWEGDDPAVIWGHQH